MGMKTLAALISFPHISIVHCLPLSSLQSRDQSQTVGYVEDPNGRGTFGLISSCVLTLVLCVWSALHLNVPATHERLPTIIWRYVRWIIAGVYAPELVVFTAWRQWNSANYLSSAVDESYKELKLRKPEWSSTHSFFACAGGFALQINGPKEGSSASLFPKGDRQRLTLTARGVELLARCGHLPDIREEDIEDKSKANSLAKALVVMQALWMLVQVLGRVIVRLPVTLLEINTVAHV